MLIVFCFGFLGALLLCFVILVACLAVRFCIFLFALFCYFVRCCVFLILIAYLGCF